MNNALTFTAAQLIQASRAVHDFDIAEAQFQACAGAFIRSRASSLISAWSDLIKTQDALGFEFFATAAKTTPPASVRAACAIIAGNETANA